MPVAHVLVGADGDDLADLPAADNILQRIVEVGVPQDVAEDDVLVGVPFRHLQYLPALTQIGGDGLLHEHVIPQLKRRYGVANVLAVHGGHHAHVGKPPFFKHLLCAPEAVFIGNIIELPGLFDLVRIEVGHGHDLHAVREKFLHGGVGTAAVAEAGDGECYRCVHSIYHPFQMFLVDAPEHIHAKLRRGRPVNGMAGLAVLQQLEAAGTDGQSLVEMQQNMGEGELFSCQAGL